LQTIARHPNPYLMELLMIVEALNARDYAIVDKRCVNAKRVEAKTLVGSARGQMLRQVERRKRRSKKVRLRKCL